MVEDAGDHDEDGLNTALIEALLKLVARAHAIGDYAFSFAERWEYSTPTRNHRHVVPHKMQSWF